MCICPTFLKIEIEFNGYMALARLWNVLYLNESLDQYGLSWLQFKHAEYVLTSRTYAVWDFKTHILQCKTQCQWLCQYTVILFWMYRHFSHNMSIYKCHVDTLIFSMHYPIMIWTMGFKYRDKLNTHFLSIEWHF